MSDQQPQQPQGEQPAQRPPAAKGQVDMEALTAAVERLLRRDLARDRERLRVKRRTTR